MFDDLGSQYKQERSSKHKKHRVSFPQRPQPSHNDFLLKSFYGNISFYSCNPVTGESCSSSWPVNYSILDSDGSKVTVRLAYTWLFAF